MTCMPTTHDGYKGAIGWYVAAVIIGNFDANIAAVKAKQAVDPTYKRDPFADKHPKTGPNTSADAIAIVTARVNARKS